MLSAPTASYVSICHPAGGATVHPRSRQVPFLVVPEAGVTEAHDRDAPGLDADPLDLATLRQVGGRNDATRL